jgi:glycerate kinase
MAARILVSPTAFKGTLSPREAAERIGEGLRHVLPSAAITILPVADGGDGFLECLAGDTPLSWVTVSGPLGAPVEASFALRPDGAAVIEMARASGLALLSPGSLDPLRATTRGSGELIRAAAAAGATSVLLGLGGSATNDGGAGCLSALGFRFLDAAGKPIAEGGGGLSDVVQVIPAASHDWPQIRCACDVTNPLLGPHGATAVFGPQKGVGPGAMSARLEEGLRRLASLGPPGLAEAPMTGAAGGLSFGLAAFAGAKLERGSHLVLAELGFERQLGGHDVLVTGEGKLDGQTAHGKVAGEVLLRGSRAGLRCYALCGVLGEGWRELSAQLAADPVAVSQPDPSKAGEALSRAAAALARTHLAAPA